jgi:hypothetical protein
LNVADEFRPGLAVEAGMKYVAASAETPLELSFTNRNPYPISDMKITISTTSSQVSILEGPTSINLKNSRPRRKSQNKADNTECSRGGGQHFSDQSIRRVQRQDLGISC